MTVTKERSEANGAHSGSAERSLEHLAFDMMPGDVIYVKHGPQIAGKGVVTDGYAYDPNILRGTKCPWGRFLRVVWEQDFPTFECLLGAEPRAILPITGERLELIAKCEAACAGTA